MIEHLQYLCVAGSHAYGTNTENSDIDIRGWFFPDKASVLGVFPKPDTWTDDSTDTVLFSFHKFIHQLTQCNPNVVEWVGVNPEHQLYVSPAAKRVLNNLHLFLSKRVYYTFGGYANHMLKMIENNYIFGTPMIHRNNKKGVKMYKHASHLLRLYYTGIEILKTGEVHTYRQNELDILKAVRAGEMTIEDVFTLRHSLVKELNNANINSKLPDMCNTTAVNDFVVKLMSEELNNPNIWSGELNDNNQRVWLKSKIFDSTIPSA